MHRHILAIIVISIPVISLLAYLVPYSLWKYTKEANLGIGFFTLANLRIRRLPGWKLVRALKIAHDHGVAVTLSELEVHYEKGGDVIRWIEGYIESREAGWNISLYKAAELELDGLEILKVAEIMCHYRGNYQAV